MNKNNKNFWISLTLAGYPALPDIRQGNLVSGRIPDIKKAGYPAGRISGASLSKIFFKIQIVPRSLLSWTRIQCTKLNLYVILYFLLYAYEVVIM
jgi:hypothetical protein